MSRAADEDARAGAWRGAEEPADGGDEQLGDALGDDPAGPIAFSHHLSRRQRGLWPALLRLFSLVMMLGALLLLVLYKDRCAAEVARAIGVASQPPGGPSRGAALLPDGGR